MRRILIHSYPNREIRVCLVREQVSARKTHETHNETEEATGTGGTPTCHSRKTLKGPKEPPPRGELELPGPSGWGGLPRYQKFSTYARRQILRAGGALETAAPYSECLFLTLTLPGSTKVSFEALARYSGMAVQRLKAWIGYRISSNLSIYTWEWQKRGALHLHYVVHCPDRGVGEYIASHLKTEWIRILDSIGKASGVDMYRKHEGFSWASNKEITRVDAQWCERSVAAYLSKYVSKASNANFKMPRSAFCPSRWYGVSRPLNALLREMTWKVSVESLTERWGAAAYEDCLSVLQAYALKCYEYKHEVGSGKSIVAYVKSEEQTSLWESIMSTLNIRPDSYSSTEKSMRRLARNGVLLMRKQKVWHDSFTQFCANTYIYRIMQLPSFRDITRRDLVFLVDMLAYAFRYTQRTRFELPGECKLWYSQITKTIEEAPPEDKEWIGALKM